MMKPKFIWEDHKVGEIPYPLERANGWGISSFSLCRLHGELGFVAHYGTGKIISGYVFDVWEVGGIQTKECASIEESRKNVEDMMVDELKKKIQGHEDEARKIREELGETK